MKTKQNYAFENLFRKGKWNKQIDHVKTIVQVEKENDFFEIKTIVGDFPIFSGFV